MRNKNTPSVSKQREYFCYSIVILTSPFEITVRVNVFVSSFHSDLPCALFEPVPISVVGCDSNPEISMTEVLKSLGLSILAPLA